MCVFYFVLFILLKKMQVVTRFAPSPTGYLHLGNARTALFNFLYARHCGGKFLLRIEDTDKERYNKDAESLILKSLKWLGLSYDGEVVYQSTRAALHQEAANELVERGFAYHCYTPFEEINVLRQEAIKQGTVYRFKSKWRDSKEPCIEPSRGTSQNQIGRRRCGP